MLCCGWFDETMLADVRWAAISFLVMSPVFAECNPKSLQWTDILSAKVCCLVDDSIIRSSAQMIFFTALDCPSGRVADFVLVLLLKFVMSEDAEFGFLVEPALSGWTPVDALWMLCGDASRSLSLTSC